MMMKMSVFKTFGQIFQKHLYQNASDNENPDVVSAHFINLRKNLIKADCDQKTGTQNQKIFGELLFTPEIFSEKNTDQNT